MNLFHIELDQETWFCRTHLDDLKNNIWTILGNIIQLWTILKYLFLSFCTDRTNFDYLRTFWAIHDNLVHFGPLFFKNNVWPVWTCLYLLRTVWICLRHVGPIWIFLNQGAQELDQQWITSGWKQCSYHLNKKFGLPISLFLDETK